MGSGLLLISIRRLAEDRDATVTPYKHLTMIATFCGVGGDETLEILLEFGTGWVFELD
jgi:hypothetical protein